MRKLFFIASFVLLFSLSAFAQLALPRESQRQSISQSIGDTTLTIVYHRPNVKGRKIWGCQTTDVLPKGGVTYPCLVPNGQVWRTGANENTTFEVSRDVMINGQPLTAGKYGFHAIPNQNEWILIFSKVNDAWGSFTYDQKNDALRVTAKPVQADFQETLSYDVENITANSGQVVVRWEKLAVPFTVDIGDIQGRTLAQVREAIKNRKPDDVRPLNQGAGYVLSSKQKNSYEEAIGWLDESLKTRETFGTLATKARILAEMGKTQEAIALGEKAVQVGKAATPPANTADFERILAEWKTKK
jgi:hypothetical protein